jgi:predicted TPR repeat methyltransferase
MSDDTERKTAAQRYASELARLQKEAGGNTAPADIYQRLGAVLWKQGDSAGALVAFEQSMAGNAGSAEAHYNLGSAQLEAGKFAEALGSAQEALRLRPGFSEARLLCAAGLAATGAIEAGAELVAQLGRVEMPAAQAYLLLAIRLLNSRLFDAARPCLERVLREDPGEVMARHLLSAVSGENPDRPVDGYVRQLFDASAATFDQELVTKLEYVVPREMVEVLTAVAAVGGPDAPWDVLDLGCGTGLVGVEIASRSRRLTGIDLAPNMIERARARDIYTLLRCEDLVTALSREARYDVITAADVFIYVGKLDAVIPAIRGALRPGGLFAFSAEAVASPAGYRLGLMGRYAHDAGYLQGLAAENGLAVELLRETRIRFEHRRPVRGWLTVWRAPGASAVS